MSKSAVQSRPKVQDRRSAIRVEPEAYAPIRVDINGADFIDIFYATDISKGGIGLKVPHRFRGCKTERMVECLVQLPLPVHYSFHAQGKVVHISGDRFGVSFYNLQEKTEARLEDYINYRLKGTSWWSWAAHQVGLDSISTRFL